MAASRIEDTTIVHTPPSMWTVGHSNRPIEVFIDLLQRNGVARVIDVRTMPRSRYNPQFNVEVLPASLAEVGIDHTHIAGLGGLRKPRADSPNAGWENLSFRGYADYMQTAAFVASLERAIEFASKQRCALMCAEAVPWRCHRSMIADALIVRGFEVFDIIGPGDAKLHKLTRFAHVEGTTITYPPITGVLL
jgi:uncharacterized protein (DUF488 family)